MPRMIEIKYLCDGSRYHAADDFFGNGVGWVAAEDFQRGVLVTPVKDLRDTEEPNPALKFFHDTGCLADYLEKRFFPPQAAPP
ncbi:MAG TPA: hypothetical protein VMW38_24990 [Terriglobia bacterium]|nr:hypothetical protein [Terriglobia bacterium]